jgi:hypothetical protein
MTINNNNSNFTEEEMNIILGISNNVISDELNKDVLSNIQTDIIIIDDAEKLRIKKEKLRLSQKKYLLKNKEKIYAYNRQYFKNKYDNDKLYRERKIKEKCIELKNKRDSSPEYRLKINEHVRIYNNEMRSKSPEFKKLTNDRANKYYHKKKLLNEMTNIIVSTC